MANKFHDFDELINRIGTDSFNGIMKEKLITTTFESKHLWLLQRVRLLCRR